MRADAELPWYFGSGASTWAGDAGLRSPMGGQLSAARQVKRVHVDNPPWMTKGHQPHVVDASGAEDEMINRMGAAWMARQIATKLAALTRTQAEALELHYDSKTTLPYDVDACAVLLGSARRLVVAPQVKAHYDVARGALQAAHHLRPNVTAVHAELGRFLLERSKARALRRSKASVDHEILRRALHDATDVQRKSIAEQAAKLVQRAKEAYEAVRIEDPGRPVQVRDPRRNRG